MSTLPQVTDLMSRGSRTEPQDLYYPLQVVLLLEPYTPLHHQRKYTKTSDKIWAGFFMSPAQGQSHILAVLVSEYFLSLLFVTHS